MTMMIWWCWWWLLVSLLVSSIKRWRETFEICSPSSCYLFNGPPPFPSKDYIISIKLFDADRGTVLLLFDNNFQMILPSPPKKNLVIPIHKRFRIPSVILSFLFIMIVSSSCPIPLWSYIINVNLIKCRYSCLIIGRKTWYKTNLMWYCVVSYYL